MNIAAEVAGVVVASFCYALDRSEIDGHRKEN